MFDDEPQCLLVKSPCLLTKPPVLMLKPSLLLVKPPSSPLWSSLHLRRAMRYLPGVGSCPWLTYCTWGLPYRCSQVRITTIEPLKATYVYGFDHVRFNHFKHWGGAWLCRLCLKSPRCEASSPKATHHLGPGPGKRGPKKTDQMLMVTCSRHFVDQIIT